MFFFFFPPVTILLFTITARIFMITARSRAILFCHIIFFFFVGYNDLALSSHRGKRSSIFILVIHETRMFYTFHLSGVFF